MEENHDKLLLEVTKVRNNHKLFKADFNVLTTFLRPSNEVELHSRFITWLLDPRAPHKLGELPLKLFLLQIGSQFTVSDTTKVTPNAVNWTEDRDMDILIYDEVQKFAIIIENKIYAKDSDMGENNGQLARYLLQVETGGRVKGQNLIEIDKYYSCKNKKVELYYLTLDMHEPNEKKFQPLPDEKGQFQKGERKVEIHEGKDYEGFRRISYLNHIELWLDEVLQTANPSPLVKELINEYKDALYCVSPNSALNVDSANIFNENDTLRENLKAFIKDYKSQEIVSFDQKGEFFREIFKDDSLVDAAVFLLTNYRHIYWHALNDFFIKLQDELHSRFGDNLLPRIDINTGKEKTIDKYVSEIIFEEKNASKLSPMYYRIRLKNGEEWTLQPDRSRGFFLGIDCTTKPNKEHESSIKSHDLKGYSTKENGWYAVKYLEDKKKALNLWDFTQGQTFDLLNEERRQEIAEQYAAFVEQELNKIN